MVRRFFRYWWVIIITVLIGGGATVGLALLKKHQYRSEVTVLYREVIKANVLYGEDNDRERDDVATRLAESALARPRLEELINDFDLFPLMRDEKGMVAAVDEMRKRIEFKARGGDVFYIAFVGDTPEEAYTVTEQLAQTLIDKETQQTEEQVIATKKFLEEELERTQTALEDTEAEVSKFLEKHPHLALDTLNPAAPGVAIRGERQQATFDALSTAPTAPVVVQKSTDPVLSSLYAKEARIRSRARDQQRRGPRSDLSRAADAIKEELNSARSDLRRKSQKYTPKHPDVKAASARVSLLQRRYNQAQERIRADLAAKNPRSREIESELKSIRAKISRRRKYLREKEKDERTADRRKNRDRDKDEREDKDRDEDKETGGSAVAKTLLDPGVEGFGDESIVSIETHWARLYREYTQLLERYEHLERKHFRASIDANSQLAQQATQMQVIDPAYHPNRPLGAGRQVIVMAGVAAAAMIGLGLAFLLALMDDRIRLRGEFERLGIMPFLVAVPKETNARRHRQRPPDGSRKRQQAAGHGPEPGQPPHQPARHGSQPGMHRHG